MLSTRMLNKIREDMTLALSMVEATHNIQFKIGKITYSSYTFSCKLEAGLAKEGTEANIEKNIWDKDAYMFGFTKEDFGKSFKDLNGKIYTITAVNTRRTKMPITAIDHLGTSYKFRSELVKTGLTRMANSG
jgi:hypothetical protein